jgi:hypothetical protein
MRHSRCTSLFYTIASADADQAIAGLDGMPKLACNRFRYRDSIAQSDSQLIQPRSRNMILSCSAIASAIALALPSSVLLPLTSP